jgi:hypothetical protein
VDHIRHEIREILAIPATKLNHSIPHHPGRKMTGRAHITTVGHPQAALHYPQWPQLCLHTTKAMDLLLQMDMHQIQDIVKNTGNRLLAHIVMTEDTQATMDGASNQCLSPNLPQDKERR